MYKIIKNYEQSKIYKYSTTPSALFIVYTRIVVLFITRLVYDMVGCHKSSSRLSYTFPAFPALKKNFNFIKISFQATTNNSWININLLL